ncbi:ATP-binding protein [Streptomyces sp. NPDC058284]|uniref:ATP-binding protein n=1 Tax=unclassified Streptomyces TaxID=2593676 RepID=UPI0036516611
MPAHPVPRPLDWGLAMGLGIPAFAAHRFRSDPRALVRIRTFIAQTLRQWELTTCLDDTVLVASELASNCLLHTLQTGHEHDAGWLGLAHTRHAVLCTVTDPSPVPAAPQQHDLLAETGRGLRIVQALSDDWGCTVPADGPGKTVWARIAR